jgi:hypothetical protein
MRNAPVDRPGTENYNVESEGDAYKNGATGG